VPDETPRGLAAAEQGLGRLAGLFAVLSGLALFVLAAVTLVSVFWRYVLRDPIFGIEDVSTMALVVVVAGSILYGALHGSHVTVNIIAMFATRRVTRITDVVSRATGIAITAFATYGLVVKGSCGQACGAFTSNLYIQHLPYYFVLAVAMGAYCLLLILHLLIGLARWDGTDPNEAHD